MFNKITLTLAGATFWIADAFTRILHKQLFLWRLILKLVCDPGKTSNTCLDLLGIIGGESDDDEDSIIGSLTKKFLLSPHCYFGSISGYYSSLSRNC